MAVKTLDAGGDFLLSGDTEAEVAALLQRYVSRGSKVLSPTAQVGSRWVASCTVPTRDPLAESTTLSLAAIRAAAARRDSPPPEPVDQCTVEEVGLKRMITGPSHAQVLARVEYLRYFGGRLVGDIEETGGSWVALVDTGGETKPQR